jgi:hypothetical protein
MFPEFVSTPSPRPTESRHSLGKVLNWRAKSGGRLPVKGTW